MAATRPREHDLSPELVVTAVGNAERIITDLGNKPSQGRPLQTIVVESPAVLKTWAASKKRTPDAVEQKIYAQALLALCAAAVHVHYDRGPPTPHAAPAETGPAPFSGSPASVTRRGVIKATRLDTAPPLPGWIL